MLAALRPADVFACPTLYTQPHFYKSSPEVTASSGVSEWSQKEAGMLGGPSGQLRGPDGSAWLGSCVGHVRAMRFTGQVRSSSLSCLHCAGRTWPTSFKDHGWYFSVEPFSGMSIHGHKPYQFNHLVQRTDVAYPNLWVANGSASTPLGQALGMDGDFVTGKNRLAGVCLWVLLVGVPAGMLR